MCSPNCLGFKPALDASASAVPAAWPPTARVPITLVEPIASLDALISRPAIIIFEIVLLQ